MPVSLEKVRKEPPVLLREIGGTTSPINSVLRKVITFFIHGESSNKGEIIIKDTIYQGKADSSKKI